MPTDTTVVSPAQDEESDENISLDLHVSDTEETEDIVPDKNDEEIPMEIEDDILNKFEIKETLRPCDILGPDESDKEEDEGQEEAKKEEAAEEVVKESSEESKMEEDKEKEVEDKPSDEKKEEEEEVEDKQGENKTTDQTDEPPVGDADDKPSEDADKEAEGDSEDLLTIMEEKTTEADATEFENDIEEESKSDDKNDNGEQSGNNTDENQSDSDGQAQEKDEKAVSPAVEEHDDNVDAAMDIEENDLHTEQSDVNHDDEEITVKENDLSQEDLDVTVIENEVPKEENSEDGAKSDENKENVEANVGDSGKSVLELILTAKSETKSGKRLLSDESSGDESAKKIKLINKEEVPEKPQDTTVTKLNSFKKFMLDKSLKGITRDQLEIFCIQKMCECIVQKSEIGELKVKVKMQEQMLDCLRKEVVNVSKQARDLNIVHQKVIQDVTRLQENSDKPLIVPKITRSVGLQAVVRSEDNKRKTPRPASVPQSKLQPIRPKPATPATPSPIRSTATTVGQKSNIIPTTPNARIVNKTNNTNSTPVIQKAAPKTPEANGKGAGVIDLTDEDDKKPNGTPATPNGTKVNMINAPNGHKFVLMPNGQTVMVKLATPSTGNVVVTQPLVRTVSNATTNGNIRPNGVLRTVSQPVRAVMASPLRGRAPVPNNSARQPRPMYRPSLPQKVPRHPAALPNATPVNIEGAKPIPPKPHLMLNKTNCGTGIVLSWKMPYKLDLYEKIASYQLYAYQETKSEPKTENWGKIGDVKALELPMAVTLTHFAVGNRYFFAVRAVDNLSRPGEFSHYETILL